MHTPLHRYFFLKGVGEVDISFLKVLEQTLDFSRDLSQYTTVMPMSDLKWVPIGIYSPIKVEFDPTNMIHVLHLHCLNLFLRKQ